MKQAKSMTLSSKSEKPGYTSIMTLDPATQLRMASEEQAESTMQAAMAFPAEAARQQAVNGTTKETVAVVLVMTVFTAVFWFLISCLHG